MIEQAIEKINTEMQKNPSDKYTEVIGHYCIDHVTNETAEMFLAEGKTLKGALDAVVAHAEKMVKTRSGAQKVVLTGDEAFSEVNKYFGLQCAEGGAVYTFTKTPTKPKAPSLNLDFNSFL